MLRAATFTLLASLFCAGMAGAQSGPDVGGPQEMPPSDFADTQYVDSRGCVFMRAGYGGETRWVARVTRERTLLCGYPPSISAAPPEPLPPATTVAAVDRPVTSDKPTVAEKTPSPVRVRHNRLRHRSVALKISPVTCPEDAPYRGTFTTEDGAVRGICSSNPERGVLVETVPVPTLVPEYMAGPMALRGGVLKPRGNAMELHVSSTTAQVYVQVGTYGEPANVAAAQARVADLGLQVAGAEIEQDGRALQIVLAGPFSTSDQAHMALKAARDAGFRDAFVR